MTAPPPCPGHIRHDVPAEQQGITVSQSRAPGAAVPRSRPSPARNGSVHRSPPSTHDAAAAHTARRGQPGDVPVQVGMALPTAQRQQVGPIRRSAGHRARWKRPGSCRSAPIPSTGSDGWPASPTPAAKPSTTTGNRSTTSCATPCSKPASRTSGICATPPCRHNSSNRPESAIAVVVRRCLHWPLPLPAHVLAHDKGRGGPSEESLRAQLLATRLTCENGQQH